METQKSVDTEPVNYNVTLETSAWAHIEKQVVLNKSTKDPSFTKRRWIVDSILEKISNAKAEDVVTIKRKSISFAISKFIQKKIELVITFYKKYDPTYSKNQFFMDAIAEKITRERNQIKEDFKSSEEIELMLEKLISSQNTITK